MSSLFSALNVALSAIEFDEESGANKLMDVQEVARSINALKSAPPLVVSITEDVLAQTSAAHSSLLTNPLTREWQARVYPACQRAVDGLYPFGEGGDAGMDEFRAFFGAQGVLSRFVEGAAKPYLDQNGETWRWKPEARLSGVGQDSAVFLQRGLAISAAFFGANNRFGGDFEVAALAERGTATMAIGGVARPVSASGTAERLDWPGPDPRVGSEIALRQGASTVRATEAGHGVCCDCWIQPACVPATGESVIWWTFEVKAGGCSSKSPSTIC